MADTRTHCSYPLRSYRHNVSSQNLAEHQAALRASEVIKYFFELEPIANWLKVDVTTDHNHYGCYHHQFLRLGCYWVPLDTGGCECIPSSRSNSFLVSG